MCSGSLRRCAASSRSRQPHISRSLRKTLRTHPYSVRVDTDFAGRHPWLRHRGTERETTWINGEIRRLYGALFDRGYVHTVEVWDGPDLVGGLYGVSIGAAFFGEIDVPPEDRLLQDRHGASDRPPACRAATACSTPSSSPTICGPSAASKSPREDYELRLADALAHEADWRAIDNL